MLKEFKADSVELETQEKEALRKFDLGVLDQLDKQVIFNPAIKYQFM